LKNNEKTYYFNNETKEVKNAYNP